MTTFEIGQPHVTQIINLLKKKFKGIYFEPMYGSIIVKNSIRPLAIIRYDCELKELVCNPMTTLYASNIHLLHKVIEVMEDKCEVLNK